MHREDDERSHVRVVCGVMNVAGLSSFHAVDAYIMGSVHWPGVNMGLCVMCDGHVGGKGEGRV